MTEFPFHRQQGDEPQHGEPPVEQLVMGMETPARQTSLRDGGAQGGARTLAAYQKFKQSGHGDAALLYNGKRVKHYGLTDQKEFFAEMTESYFGVNDFFPFNRAELQEAEPELFQLLKEIWSAEKR